MARLQSSLAIVSAGILALFLLLSTSFQSLYRPYLFYDDYEEDLTAVKSTGKSTKDVHIQSQYEAHASPANYVAYKSTDDVTDSATSSDPPVVVNGTRKDFWSVEDGYIFPGDTLTSLNGLYTMNMSRTGELKIFRHYHDLATKPLFWTNNDFQWVGSKYAKMGEDGIFNSWHNVENFRSDHWQGDDITNAAFKADLKKIAAPAVDKRHVVKRGYEPFEGPFRTWSTISFPECQKRPEKGMTAVLVLTNTGALQIKHIREMDLEHFKHSRLPVDEEFLLYPVCEIFEGEREEMSGDMGRLAVVLAGTMRSWKRTCKSLNDKVLEKWPGKGGIDVFVATGDTDVYGYSDGEEVPWRQISEQLNQCLGGRLRRLEHAPLETEVFPRLRTTGGKCNGGMQSQHRLLNQVKTTWRGGQLVQEHAILTGAKYDYVLKMRPDHLIWGDAVPPFKPLALDVISYPMPYWEPPTWSMRHDRTAHSTPSDQMAFGRLQPMMTYLSLYPSYVNIVRASQSEGGQDYPPCYVPNVPCPDREGHSPCFIEGLSGYWPVLNGIKVKLDWRWKINLLREGEGELSKEWRAPWNQTQGTRYVENAFD